MCTKKIGRNRKLNAIRDEKEIESQAYLYVDQFETMKFNNERNLP